MNQMGTIASVCSGYRNEMNVNFPVEKHLRADPSGGFIVVTTCNGNSERVRKFATEGEARKYMSQFGEIVEM